MNRIVLAIALLLISPPAWADQFAAIFRFTGGWSAVRSDPDIQQYVLDNQQVRDLLRDRAIEINVWRHSQDTVSTGPDGEELRIHSYFSGAVFLVTWPRLIPALRDHPALQVVFNLDKCFTRQVGCVVRSNVSNTILQDLRFSPIVTLRGGENMPWGDLQ